MTVMLASKFPQQLRYKNPYLQKKQFGEIINGHISPALATSVAFVIYDNDLVATNMKRCGPSILEKHPNEGFGNSDTANAFAKPCRDEISRHRIEMRLNRDRWDVPS
jgi:hypothetical protein